MRSLSELLEGSKTDGVGVVRAGVMYEVVALWVIGVYLVSGLEVLGYNSRNFFGVVFGCMVNAMSLRLRTYGRV